ncbi:MAG: hypothetical protein MP439_10790 [Ferrimicrobium sp.]|nr:hypothetical protein [Ferrimicrobium sp.]
MPKWVVERPGQRVTSCDHSDDPAPFAHGCAMESMSYSLQVSSRARFVG